MHDAYEPLPHQRGNAPDIPVLVIVGDLSRWDRLGRELPKDAGVIYVTIDDLTPDILRQYDPMLVMSPLVTPQFDATEVARRLVSADFPGPYRAINDACPDAEMIVKEVATVAPDLDFGVI